MKRTRANGVAKHTPADYVYIAAWGHFMQWFAFHIAEQQELAAKANAPTDVIFKRFKGPWVTVAELGDSPLRQTIEEFLHQPYPPKTYERR